MATRTLGNGLDRWQSPVVVQFEMRVTPAMAAGVTLKFWEMSDMVQVLEAWEA